MLATRVGRVASGGDGNDEHGERVGARTCTPTDRQAGRPTGARVAADDDNVQKARARVQHARTRERERARAKARDRQICARLF